MPATEQTWRGTKWMHLVFGFTVLAMLLVTLWMFADDHNREWKNYQQTFYHDVEVWLPPVRMSRRTISSSGQRKLDKRSSVNRKAYPARH